MNQQIIAEVVDRVNQFFDEEYKSGKSPYELCANGKYIEEHDYCYAIGWCLKNEVSIQPSKRTIFAGGGPMLVSKLCDAIEMAGSSPNIDFVKEFELKIRGLEGYWNLEIEYDKSKLSSLKSLLNLSTPRLLELVHTDSKIHIEKVKYELDILHDDLSQAGIKSEIAFKERKRRQGHE